MYAKNILTLIRVLRKKKLEIDQNSHCLRL